MKIGYYLTGKEPSKSFISDKKRRTLFKGSDLHPEVASIFKVLKEISGLSKNDIEILAVKNNFHTKCDAGYWLPILNEAGCVTPGELKTAGSIEIEMPKKPVTQETEAPVAAPVAVPVPKKKAAPKKKPATVAVDTVVQIPVKKKEIGGTTYYLGPEDKVFDMKFKYVGRYDKEADEVNRDILDSD